MGPRINACIDGELDEKDRQDVEQHLESCPSCRQLRFELEQVGDMIKDGLSPDTVPDIDLTGVWENIQSQIKFGPSVWQRLKELIGKPAVWLPTAVATAAVAMLVFLLPIPKQQPQMAQSRVESVYSRSGQVMVMETAKSSQPLIWILPEAEKEVTHEI